MRAFSPSVILVAAVLLLAGCAAQRPALSPGEQVPRALSRTIEKTVEVDYLLYLPDDYESREAWPLVLFLHGAGERGDSLGLVETHGPPKLVSEGRSFPFILVSPQVPEGERWSAETLDVLLDEVAAAHRVDLDRVYVTGLSMGGFGTWELALAYPDRFAAIAPICGGGTAWAACRIKDVPTWVFHGAQDRVVPIERSEEMVEALRRCEGNVRFTTYPDAGHDAWTETYANPELYDWLLQQRRRPSAERSVSP